MSVKSVLREELENSISMKELFEQKLAELPRGSIASRKISGKNYFYLVYRENGKVRTDYLGKDVPEDKRAEYEKAKEKRARLRNDISKLKKQIKFLKGVLRGKEEL